jgi:hypothetical protein
MPVYGRFLIEGTPRHAEIQDGKAYLIDDLLARGVGPAAILHSISCVFWRR